MIKEMCNIPDSVLVKLQKDIEEIKTALLGNEYNPDGGLLSRTSELEKEIEKLKNKYNRVLWTATGAGAVITFLVNLFIQFYDKFVL